MLSPAVGWIFANARACERSWKEAVPKEMVKACSSNKRASGNLNAVPRRMVTVTSGSVVKQSTQGDKMGVGGLVYVPVGADPAAINASEAAHPCGFDTAVIVEFFAWRPHARIT